MPVPNQAIVMSLALLLLVATFGSRSAAAQDAAQTAAQTTLTADDVARRAIATSATLAARRAEVDAAQAAVFEARVALLPRVVGAARYTRLSNITAPTLGNIVIAPAAGTVSQENFPVAVAFRFPVLLDQYVFQASASLPLSDYLLRFPHTTTAAREAMAAAQATARAAEVRLAGEARSLYYAWARARLQHEVATSAREQTRAHRAQIEAGRDAGRHTDADVLRVESQLAAADLMVLRTQNLAALLEDQLRTVLHDPPTVSYAIGADLDAQTQTPPTETSPTPAITSDAEAAYAQALQGRGELAALAHAGEQEQAQARGARALMLPRLEAYGALLSANPNARFFPPQDRFATTWELGLQLVFSPNDVLGGLAIARRHRSRAAAAAAEHQAVGETIRAEVLAAHRMHQEAAAALVTTARGLKAAEESYRVRRVLFAEGRATSFELTDAETELVRAKFAAIDARIDAGLARAGWHKAMGTATEGKP